MKITVVFHSYEKFSASLSEYRPGQRETVQKAIDSGVLNNTNRTREMVSLVAKLAEEKGISFDFVNNKKLKETGFALEGKTVDGFVTNGNITLNVNSAKTLNTVVGHEIAHVLEGTELYSSLQESITRYAKEKGDYDKKLQTVSELYKDVKDANVEGEVTADLIGEYLFSDKDFVNRLSTENRNVFQKIFDEIKYLCKAATAGSKEARELEKIRHTFEEVYRQSANVKTEAKGKVDFSFGVTQDDINNYVEAAYKNENDADYKKYAEVSDRLLNDVSDEIDLNGYAHALRDNDIRHIRNSHGENTPEKYPVTKEDMKNIPWLVENYDKVFIVRRNSGKVGIIYVKTAQDGLVYYLEQVTSVYGNEPLLINKQMIKTGIDDIPDLPGLKDAITKKQSEIEFLDDLKKAPKVYAQGVYQSHSIDSVPNSEDSVKTEFSISNDSNGKELSKGRQYYSAEDLAPVRGISGKDVALDPAAKAQPEAAKTKKSSKEGDIAPFFTPAKSKGKSSLLPDDYAPLLW